jgi:hypothetical protein
VKVFYLFIVIILSLSDLLVAQEDLSKLFDNGSNESKKDRSPVYASFKSPRIINAKSNETVKKNELDFVISHRFGDAAGKHGGAKTFFGTDAAADIRIALDYGITDRLTVGISRSKGATAIRQLYEGNLKFKLLQQTIDNHVPLGITLYGNGVVSSMKSNTNATVPDHFDKFSDRWSFFAQAIFVRKFSRKFTLAVLPSFVHWNRVGFGDENDTYSLGAAARLKISKRMALIADYFYVFKSKSSRDFFKTNGLSFYNPLGLGLEIETGGHIFQITFMNSTALLENQFIPYTTTTWTKGQFRWGFSISRTFALGGNKKDKIMNTKDPSTSKLSKAVLVDNFSSGEINNWWAGSDKVNLTKMKQMLKVDLNAAGAGFETFGRDFKAIDFSKTPVLKIRMKAIGGKPGILRVDIKDFEGNTTNANPVTTAFHDTTDFVDYYFDFTGKFEQAMPTVQIVNKLKIEEILLFVNPGEEPYSGTILIDEIKAISLEEYKNRK